VTTAATASEPVTSGDREAENLARVRGIDVAEARRRLHWQALAPDLAQRVEQEPGFGGAWIDVNGGDRMKIAFVGDLTDDLRDRVRRAAQAVGLSEGYDLVAVRHSQRELNAASDWLTAQLATVNVNAQVMISAGERTDLNRIELQAPADDAQSAEQRDFVARAETRLGDLLHVSVDAAPATPLACKYPFCDPPLRAGVRIVGAKVLCTGAFIAKSRVDAKLYMFTAGHCVWNQSGMWETRAANIATHVAIGPAWKSMWVWPSPIAPIGAALATGDAAILQIQDSAADPQPIVFTSTDFRYAVRSDNYSMVGMQLCTSGSFYGQSDCGFVTQLNVTVTYDDPSLPETTVPHLGRASYCSIKGDSGGPVYVSHIALGINVAAFSTCDSLYQGIRAAETALNVDVLHAS
jgi:streptogrisin C